MSDADQKKPDAVKARLQEAFAVSRAQAYELFKTRTLRVDESIDAYAADLQRLLALSGHESAGDADKDPVVVEQFLAGLPKDFSRQVRLSIVGGEASVTNCTERVRALRLSESAVGRGADGNSVAAATQPVARDSRGGKNVLCYRCKELGHIRRDCPQKAGGGGKGKSARQLGGSASGTCFFCDGAGHVKANCPERRAWLAGRKETAAAVDDARCETKQPCLCTVNSARAADLPCIFVDVLSSPISSEWHRARAVIDSGSTCTLVSRAFADRVDI